MFKIREIIKDQTTATQKVVQDEAKNKRKTAIEGQPSKR